jgi:hypothetical protein
MAPPLLQAQEAQARRAKAVAPTSVGGDATDATKRAAGPGRADPARPATRGPAPHGDRRGGGGPDHPKAVREACTDAAGPVTAKTRDLPGEDLTTCGGRPGEARRLPDDVHLFRAKALGGQDPLRREGAPGDEEASRSPDGGE